MRAVFCGSPDFALPSLRALLDSDVEVPLVVSQPDRVRGRRAAPTPTPVRQLALERGVPTRVLEKGRRRALYEEILALDPDVAVVVAFGHIVREPLLHGPRLGCVNVHASLLPRWRGPAPIHRAILAGDTRTGVCTMALAEGVDTGDVYLCRQTEIGENETAGELHDRLAILGAQALLPTLEGLDRGDLPATPQPETGVTHAPMLHKSEGSVDFHAPAERVHDRIRGLDPWPGVSVEWGGERVRLSGSRLADERAEDGSPGLILDVDETGALIACARGRIRVTAVRPSGRRTMKPLDFVQGRPGVDSLVLRPLPGFRPRPEES